MQWSSRMPLARSRVVVLSTKLARFNRLVLSALSARSRALAQPGGGSILCA